MTDLNNILKIKANNFEPVKGQVLISEPFLIDYYFKRSVVLLAEHNSEGSFGLIINKPINLSLNEVVQNFPEMDAPVYLGGPVKSDNLYFIHNLGDQIENSIKIFDNLYWGGDIEHIKELILLKQLSNKNIKFFLGYSGWVSKQLESELSKNSWIVADISEHQVMQKNTDTMWDSVVKQMGDDYAMWPNFPDDPSMN